MPRKSFRYGGDRIEYEVVFKPAKHNRLAIHVHPDGFVQVDAPQERDLPTIHRAVLKRARWIKRHVDESRRQRAQALPRNYRSGESLFYLGRRYQLKVKEQHGQEQRVKLTRGQICVETPLARSLSDQRAPCRLVSEPGGRHVRPAPECDRRPHHLAQDDARLADRSHAKTMGKLLSRWGHPSQPAFGQSSARMC